MTEARECLVGSFKEHLDPLVVHHFRAVDPGFEQETFGVYQQMSLPALDLFASYSITTLIASHTGAFDLPWESTT